MAMKYGNNSRTGASLGPTMLLPRSGQLPSSYAPPGKVAAGKTPVNGYYDRSNSLPPNSAGAMPQSSPAPVEPGGVKNPMAGKSGFDPIGDMRTFSDLPGAPPKSSNSPFPYWKAWNMLNSGSSGNNTIGNGTGWLPEKGTVPPSMNVGALFGGMGGGSGNGGSGGGGGGWTRNPQPNYMPTYNTIGGGLGFGGGTGWAGTSVAGYKGNYDGNGGETGGSSMNGFVGQGSPGFGFANWKRQAAQQGGSGGLGDIANSYQQAHDGANKANNDRYNNILGGYQDSYERAMASLEGVGNQQRTDLQKQYDRNGESIKAGLVGRGMSNTTVRDTMLNGNERERSQGANRLEEALTRERLGYDTGLRKDLLSFMERRTDKGPDLSQLLAIAQAMGLGGVGAGAAAMAGGGGMSMAAPVMVNGVAGGGYGAGNMGGFGGAVGGGRALTPYQQMILAQNMAARGRGNSKDLANMGIGGNIFGFDPFTVA